MEERYFSTVLLEEAQKFVDGLDPKVRAKLIYKIDSAETTRDPVIFKKLKHDIGEFRLWHRFTRIRLLAFWDKSDSQHTLVMATHGFIKKADKTPGKEIERAINCRNKYFENKK